jgi:hypothetical protein
MVVREVSTVPAHGDLVAGRCLRDEVLVMHFVGLGRLTVVQVRQGDGDICYLRQPPDKGAIMQPPSHDPGLSPDEEQDILSEVQSRARSEQAARIVRLCTRSTCQRSRAELTDEMTHAELSGQLSEFYVLIFRAILTMIEGKNPDFVLYYLEMAETVAAPPEELAIVRAIRASYASGLADLPSAAGRCLARLDQLCRTGDQASC